MTRLIASVADNGVLRRKLTARCTKLVQADRAAQKAAAAEATAATRAAFTLRRPSNVPARRGRLASGQMLRSLHWSAGSEVVFDIAEADKDAPFWIIQEIGTGKSATLRRGGQANPRGRPAVGATYVRTVPSQTGRAIPGSLVWASGPSGRYSRPGSARDQQLYLRGRIKSAPQRPGLDAFLRKPKTAGRAIRITNEIHGQHFVQQGGTKAFREYRVSVLAAAQRAFAGKPRLS